MIGMEKNMKKFTRNPFENCKALPTARYETFSELIFPLHFKGTNLKICNFTQSAFMEFLFIESHLMASDIELILERWKIPSRSFYLNNFIFIALNNKCRKQRRERAQKGKKKGL